MFLDLDGTLLDIAPTPASVVVPRGLVRVLAQLQEALGGALAVLSGRAIASVDRLLAPLRLPAAGQHGAELRLEAAGPIERTVRVERPPAWQAPLAALARDHDGVLVEDKGLAIAVHHRNAPGAEPAIRRALAALAREAPEFVLRKGKCVWEILPRGCDKGAALRRLMAAPPFAGRTPIALGDDASDEDAFAAARALGGRAMPVGSGPSAALAGPQAARDWLAELAAAPPRTERPG